MLSRLLTLREQLVMGGLALALVFGSATVWWFNSRPEPPVLEIDKLEMAGEKSQTVSTPRATEVLKPPTLVTPEKAAESAPGEVAKLQLSGQTPVPLNTSTVESPAPPKLVGVSVQGAVRNPGFQWMPQDARVQELIDAAGGPTDDADLSDIKLSARLIDETVLTIPRKPVKQNEDGVLRVRGAEPVVNPAPYTIFGIGLPIAAAPSEADAARAAAAPPSSSTDKSTSGVPAKAAKVDVNTASQQELETLPGIGPAFAQKIIEFRPFDSVEDLRRVPGIADKRLDALRDHVVAGPG